MTDEEYAHWKIQADNAEQDFLFFQRAHNIARYHQDRLGSRITKVTEQALFTAMWLVEEARFYVTLGEVQRA